MSAKPAAPSHPGAQTRLLVLHGPNLMVIREKLDALRRALEAEHGPLEERRFDGREASLADVFDELRTFSLMGHYKLVIVDEAGSWVSTHRAALERYAEQPVSKATLVLKADRWHKGNLDKRIATCGAVIACKPATAAEATRWISRRAETAYGCRIEKEAARHLAERTGGDLMRADQELARLSLMGEDGATLTTALVTGEVGRTSDEKAWELQAAMLEAFRSGQVAPLLLKVRELVEVAGNPETLVHYFAADMARKLLIGRRMHAAGAGQAEMCKVAQIWGDRTRPFMDLMRRLSISQAEQIFDLAMEHDRRAKSGLGDALANTETFCISATEVAQRHASPAPNTSP